MKFILKEDIPTLVKGESVICIDDFSLIIYTAFEGIRRYSLKNIDAIPMEKLREIKNFLNEVYTDVSSVFKITYIVDNETIGILNALKGATFALPENPPKTGYTFDGWFEGGNEITSSTLATDDHIVTASFTPIEYTITYNLDGGVNGSNPTEYTIETHTIILANATKENYTFNGWYDNAACEGTAVQGIPNGSHSDIELYAKFSINQYTINFVVNGGTTVDSIIADFNTAVSEPAQPTKTGYAFDDWYSDSALSTAYTFTTMPANGITLYAKWIANEYTITFMSNGGSAVEAITQDYGTPVNAPVAPTLLENVFDGWYTDEELTSEYTFTTMPAEDITLYAKWITNQYTITFMSNGGSAVEAITQDYDTAVEAPTPPTNEGYTFSGWYTDEELTIAYTFTTMPAGNITLYAKWQTDI